jgi:hypothetical protein
MTTVTMLDTGTNANPFTQADNGADTFWTGELFFRPPARSDQALKGVPRDMQEVVSTVTDNYLTHTYEGIGLSDILQAIDRAVRFKQLRHQREDWLSRLMDMCQYTIEHIFYDPLGVLTWYVIDEVRIYRDPATINVLRLKDAMADLVEMGLVTKPAPPHRFSIYKTSQLTEAGHLILEKMEAMGASKTPIPLFQAESRQQSASVAAR